MWGHTGRLPHVLSPKSYFDPDVYAREIKTLFAEGWHCVATRSSLRLPGDFVTVELLDEPVLVRNCDGEIRAFHNVCAHRHAMIVSTPRGNSERIRCQYHGWEYDSNGRTCKVPDASSFKPIRRGSEGLRRLRAAVCGELVFVSLVEDGPSLRDALSDRTWSVIEDRFSSAYRESGAWTIEHPANWKVVVENSLEGYHIPVVHPSSLTKLSSELTSNHVMEPRHSELSNTESVGGAAIKWVTRWWRPGHQRGYSHHLSYPSLMLALTDLSSMAQIIVPTSATSCRSLVFSFVYGDRPITRTLAPLFGVGVDRFLKQVQREDNAMFPRIQRGLGASRQPGVLGAREERIHAFQEYVARTAP